ncbi:sugar porter family MFS transporter [Bifidobacterium sp. 82T24]|uniref:Sugar porter family MFS transporter n=1 Tax=Bifidobacterium saimiriisciurei TaxID=2661627 RepID=A0ABX0C767_9BIFI|nr:MULTISPECIES: sugar porter family MFS transporter [Bifidobacterium]MBW3088738.1 sugar porter family MFS transporter [Bifidobacterium pluvialisilvae]NEG96359.1 sugar porter family MFS transporter [Bifidobacterium sp. SMB2]NEH11009.1 sugar porter family MFS transporter [Bifidobacterium saimiriisciurei]
MTSQTSSRHDDLEEIVDPVIKRRIIIVCAAAAIGGVLFGFDTAVINGAVDSIAGTATGFGLNSFMSGISVSCALLGCVLGAWFAGKLADKYGRIHSMLFAAILFIASSLGSALAPEIWSFIVFRFIGGLGVGLASVLGPAYIAEVSPTKMRGFLTSFQQFGVGIGMLASTITNSMFAKGSGGADSPFWFGLATWRWMLLIMIVPSVVMFAVSLLLPESPRYLVMKGRDEEAAATLKRINGVVNPEAKIAQIRATVGSESGAKLRDLRGGFLGLKKVVWIGILVALFQQFCGINIILYYDSSIWRSMGFSEQVALDISLYRTLAAWIPMIASMILLDRIGRKKLLAAGSIAMTVFLLIATVGFYHASMQDGNFVLPGIWAPIAIFGMYAFFLSFNFSWGAGMWVVIGEIFPNNIRAIGVAVATAFNWIGNFVVSTTFPPLRDTIGVGNVYLAYTVFALLSYLFVKKVLPETNGVALEDMKAE